VAVVEPCLIRSVDGSGQPRLRLGVALVDAYLDFVAGRCRPNTVLATAYDLRIFFAVVGKDPAQVSGADVFGFITAQRHGGDGRLQLAGDGGGVAARSVRRRLSSVSGLFAYLHARGDVAANPVPRGLLTRRERQRPRQGVPLVRSSRTLPRIFTRARWMHCWRRCVGSGTGRWCWVGCAAARSSDCAWKICTSGNGGCSSARARAGISGSCRSRDGFSPLSVTTWTSSDRLGSPLTGCSWRCKDAVAGNHFRLTASMKSLPAHGAALG